MSPGRSVASCARTFCSVRMLIIWPVMPMIEVSCERSISGVPMLTAITTSAPIARTMSIGRLSTRPPSPRIWPSYSAGEKMPGIDMLERIAW